MKYISVITFILFLTPLYTGASEFFNTNELSLNEDHQFNAFDLFEADGTLKKSILFQIQPYLLYNSSEKDPFITINQYQKGDKPSGLISRGEHWGFFNVKLAPGIFNGLFNGEAEMAYRPSSDYDYEEGFGNYQTDMLRFNIEGTLLGFEYGTKYRYVDDGFDEVPGTKFKSDNEGGEIWVEKKISYLELRTFYSNYWDNVDFEPDEIRKKTEQFGTSLNLAIPSYPSFKLSYSKGTNYKLDPGGNNLPKESIDNFSGYVYYWDPKWQLWFGANYSIIESIGFNGSNEYYEISGTYYVTKEFSLNPAIGFNKEKYTWEGGGTEYLTPTASLSISYYPTDIPVGLYTYLYYSRYKSNDGFLDTNSINAFTQLIWNLDKYSNQKKTLSLDFSYYHYLDSIYSYEYVDLSMLMTLKFEFQKINNIKDVSITRETSKNNLRTVSVPEPNVDQKISENQYTETQKNNSNLYDSNNHRQINESNNIFADKSINTDNFDSQIIIQHIYNQLNAELSRKSKSALVKKFDKKVLTINSLGANVRDGPGMGYPVLFTVDTGDFFVAAGEKTTRWVKIKTFEGKEGWIGAKLVKELSEGSI